MNIYSIKNEKLDFFNRPIYCESFNEALSYLQNVLMSDADRALIGLKDDLALYHLGEIDFVTGKINQKKVQKVCDLREIFETVPEDKIPRNERTLFSMIEKLGERVKNMEEKESDCDDVRSARPESMESVGT